MEKNMNKKEMASTLMGVGCVTMAFPLQSVILGIVGVVFGIAAYVLHNKRE